MRRSPAPAADPPPYEFTEQPGHLFRKAHQVGAAVYQALLDEAGLAGSQLTSMQFAVLCALADNGPMFQNQIGRLAAMDPATTKGVVERLAERGLVVVAADRRDRRKVRVSISASGRRLFRAMVPVGRRVTETLLLRLTPVERVALIALLKKVTAAEP